ncbi:hypothetical protein TPB0596_15160 [Tsukamurella pulmonis]|uniref:Uncharacterized protein n=1 Tax=Tsukamurella pulmonis TaxID=47312 RepID=A0A1H1GKU9_9ACTN|nr:hypothetical protein [Tsukamurella pulmonis]KXO88560.1 hypothetical protein AXK56_11440 [Tsukamurella pulmonis]KXP13372.1 hypothetical protein AXK57_04015 [Tsukamurella pulmonis]RDH12361.1 hypothetical protein DVB88_07900 [Tsukamurella pulmonis]SDR13516.1 hypothetical protein SAMN04489765_3388 [Tsukamurella pulmonis]SUP17149.1 Uncharacterised protein [Tsukamurella pulmonis]
MHHVARQWGGVGFIGVLTGIGVLAIGISATAIGAPWAWFAIAGGIALIVVGGAAMAAVSLTHRRNAWDDRGQRDPVLGEQLSPAEERRYLRRYRRGSGRRTR